MARSGTRALDARIARRLNGQRGRAPLPVTRAPKPPKPRTFGDRRDQGFELPSGYAKRAVGQQLCPTMQHPTTNMTAMNHAKAAVMQFTQAKKIKAGEPVGGQGKWARPQAWEEQGRHHARCVKDIAVYAVEDAYGRELAEKLEELRRNAAYWRGRQQQLPVGKPRLEAKEQADDRDAKIVLVEQEIARHDAYIAATLEEIGEIKRAYPQLRRYLRNVS